MATTRDYTDYLNDQVDIAPVNSQEELQASEIIESLFVQHGLETQVEEFDAPILASLSTRIYLIIMFLGMLLSGFQGTPVAVVGLALVIISFILLALARNDNDVLASIGPQARSQNVIGVHRATGPNVIKGNRPIVIVAHYDTPRENFLYDRQFAKWQPIIKRINWPLSIAVLVMTILQVIPFIPPIARRVIWVLGVLAALPLLLLGAAAVYERFAPCTTGANDNKASVAAMLGVLDMVRPGPDDAKRWAATHPKSVRRSLEEELEDEIYGDSWGEEELADEDGYGEDAGAYDDEGYPYEDAGVVNEQYGDEEAYADEETYAGADAYGAEPELEELSDEGYDEEAAASEDYLDDEYFEDEVPQTARKVYAPTGYDEPAAEEFELESPKTIRRGVALIEDLQVLPETCEIVYENLIPRDEALERLEGAAGEVSREAREIPAFLGQAGEVAGGVGKTLASWLFAARDGAQRIFDRIGEFFMGIRERFGSNHNLPEIDKADTTYPERDSYQEQYAQGADDYVDAYGADAGDDYLDTYDADDVAEDETASADAYVNVPEEEYLGAYDDESVDDYDADADYYGSRTIRPEDENAYFEKVEGYTEDYYYDEAPRAAEPGFPAVDAVEAAAAPVIPFPQTAGYDAPVEETAEGEAPVEDEALVEEALEDAAPVEETVEEEVAAVEATEEALADEAYEAEEPLVEADEDEAALEDEAPRDEAPYADEAEEAAEFVEEEGEPNSSFEAYVPVDKYGAADDQAYEDAAPIADFELIEELDGEADETLAGAPLSDTTIEGAIDEVEAEAEADRAYEAYVGPESTGRLPRLNVEEIAEPEEEVFDAAADAEEALDQLWAPSDSDAAVEEMAEREAPVNEATDLVDEAAASEAAQLDDAPVAGVDVPVEAAAVPAAAGVYTASTILRDAVETDLAELELDEPIEDTYPAATADAEAPSASYIYEESEPVAEPVAQDWESEADGSVMDTAPFEVQRGKVIDTDPWGPYLDIVDAEYELLDDEEEEPAYDEAEGVPVEVVDVPAMGLGYEIPGLTPTEELFAEEPAEPRFDAEPLGEAAADEPVFTPMVEQEYAQPVVEEVAEPALAYAEPEAEPELAYAEPVPEVAAEEPVRLWTPSEDLAFEEPEEDIAPEVAPAAAIAAEEPEAVAEPELPVVEAAASAVAVAGAAEAVTRSQEDEAASILHDLFMTAPKRENIEEPPAPDVLHEMYTMLPYIESPEPVVTEPEAAEVPVSDDTAAFEAMESLKPSNVYTSDSDSAHTIYVDDIAQYIAGLDGYAPEATPAADDSLEEEATEAEQAAIEAERAAEEAERVAIEAERIAAEAERAAAEAEKAAEVAAAEAEQAAREAEEAAAELELLEAEDEDVAEEEPVVLETETEVETEAEEPAAETELTEAELEPEEIVADEAVVTAPEAEEPVVAEELPEDEPEAEALVADETVETMPEVAVAVEEPVVEVPEAEPAVEEAVAEASEPEAVLEEAVAETSATEPVVEEAIDEAPEVEEVAEAAPVVDDLDEPSLDDIEAIAEQAVAQVEAEALAKENNDASVSQIMEGLRFSAEKDLSEDELADKDVTGLTTFSDLAQADVEDSMPKEDKSIPKPRAVDDPDWGRTNFKPSTVSVGRRAMLLDLPDPSVMSFDPLDSFSSHGATQGTAGVKATGTSADSAAQKRLDALRRVPSPLDVPSVEVPDFEDEPEIEEPVAQAPAPAPEEEPSLPKYNQSKNIGSRSPKKNAKRKMRFGRRRKNESDQQVESMGEWLGLDDDYDAKKDGRQIGTWDNFDDDGKKGKWKGGATLRSGLRDDYDQQDDANGGTAYDPYDETAYAPEGEQMMDDANQGEYDDETMTDLREAVLSLGDDDLIAHDIWFVGLGSSALDHAGMRAFLDEHRRDIRGAFLVNIDSVGAGELKVLTSEGMGNKRRADRRMVRMFSNIADALHIDLGRADYSWEETDATPAMQRSVRVNTLMGVSADGVAAHSHTSNDEPEYLNDKQIANVADLIAELIRRS